MNYQDIKKKMNEKDSLGLWDDKDRVFTLADMHKAIEVQDRMTKDFYEKKIGRMMSTSEVFREFEKRADTLEREKIKSLEERPEDKDLLLLFNSRIAECRIMQGLFQSLFTLKYLDEEVRNDETCY